MLVCQCTHRLEFKDYLSKAKDIRYVLLRDFLAFVEDGQFLLGFKRDIPQGAVFDVYKTMGNMWGEEVYQQCLEKELALRNIPFEAKKELPIFYKGEKIEKKYIPDVFCFGKIILELKAVGALADEHRRQILNYLRMTKFKLGCWSISALILA